jgi:hypothetical protein
MDRKYGAFQVKATENARVPPGMTRNFSHIPST